MEMKAVRILAKEWAQMKFGDCAPSSYALRCWIRRGRIQPAPEFIRGRWFVHPAAEYRDSHSDQHP